MSQAASHLENGEELGGALQNGGFYEQKVGETGKSRLSWARAPSLGDERWIALLVWTRRFQNNQ